MQGRGYRFEPGTLHSARGRPATGFYIGEWLSSADCAALGGTWLGEDGDCDNCPTGLGADLNGDGIVDAADLGLVLAAWASAAHRERFS